MTQKMIEQETPIKLNLNNFLNSVSFALDLAENQITSISQYHSKRIAFIALQLANEFDMSDEEKFDLYAYALLHDNGLIESYSNNVTSYKKVTIDSYLQDHCMIGEENLKSFPFLTKQENIILYHHERYDGQGYYGKKGDEIPLMAQILYFANRIDDKFELSNITLDLKKSIEEYVISQINLEFAPDLVKKYLDLSKSFSFWGSLEYMYLHMDQEDLLKDFSVYITLDQFYDMTHVFSQIIDSKSKFTAQHSKEIVRKTKIFLDLFNFSETHKKKLLIAANLHDIGKLATPVELLEKEGTLTEDEFFEIQKHAFFTHKLLKKLDFCNDILNWASFHHEQHDGSGYPFGIDEDALSLESRIISCLDFYQALTEDRPYRTALKHEDAINIMKCKLSGNSTDFDLVTMIDEVFQNA